MVEGDVFHGSMAGKLGEPKATFSIAKAAIPRTAAGPGQRRHFSWLNASQALLGFPTETAKGDVFHGLDVSQALMGFPRETAKGDVFHGLTSAKLSWASREKRPKATFFMA